MWNSSVVYQYLAVISVNILSVSYGISISWSSSNILILKSYSTPINNGIPMSDSEISWITSLLSAGGLLGTLCTGTFADSYGRKKTLLVLAFPQLASWILIFIATDATLLYISRFLAGFCGGAVFVVIPAFIAEISEDRIRGQLGVFVALSINLGILLGFIVGNYLSFFTIPKFAMCFPIIFFCTFTVFPESPIFLMNKNRFDDADKSLQLYRNSRRISNQKLDFYKNELEKLNNIRDDKIQDKRVTLKDFQLKSTRKSFVIGFMIVFLNLFCGVFVMTNYTASIFNEAGSNYSPNVAAIFVGLLQFIGTYLSTFLVDNIGRKPLLSISAFGTGISLLVFGLFSYFTSLGYDTISYRWIPLVTFSSMLFIAACGIVPLLTIIISEFMPDKLRTIGAMICTCVSWFFAFVLVYCFPTLVLLF